MPDFAEFWATARHFRGRLCNPRKPAEKAWDKAIREGANPREIIAGALAYEDVQFDCDIDNQFMCMASVFLNQWRWEQYLDEPKARAYLEEIKPPETTCKIVDGHMVRLVK